ncbi:hypothetical protein M413DRAFT_27977 [Hebeloma cylindrosporum]|uniref:JmjC domain-containing protein n=1 Tax=Hebeloma cylindrosporum TaxID=76867 RepID=A0A0C2YIF8_HEBCY|nr:hypothetical protein M413DRAFT_27977 [Hebeloma cylindrosporum h7]
MLPEDHPLSKFASAAEEFVRSTLSQHDYDNIRMRSLLRFDSPTSQPDDFGESTICSGDATEESRSKAHNGLFHMIMVLRLLDISAFYEGTKRERNIVRSTKRLEGSLYNKLYDVQTLIQNALDILSPSFFMDACEDSDRAGVSLLGQMAHTELRKDGGKIIQNFLFISLNLAWLQSAEGASASTKPWGGGLKLPMEPSMHIIDGDHSIPPNELVAIQTIFSRSQGTGTQTPLYAAMAISPLMLLLPNSLACIRWSKKKLLETSIQLGNDRPKFIVDAETLIWQTVTKICRREATAVKALQELTSALTRCELVGMGAEDPSRYWFKPNIALAVNPAAQVQGRAARHLTKKKGEQNISGETDGVAYEGAHISSEERPVVPKNVPQSGDNCKQARRKKPGHSIFSPTSELDTPKKRRKTKNSILLIPASLRRSTIFEELLIAERKTANLGHERPPTKRESSRPLIMFKPDGQQVEITARMQSQKSLDTLLELNTLIQKSYVNGTPLFLAEPSRSIFKIMKEVEYRACGTREIQEILRTKHIVVKNCQIQNHKFDERSLRTLRPLSETVTIHDQSNDTEKTITGGQGLREGTLRHMLDAASHIDGKILNALPFPLVSAGYDENPFSTDQAAWMQTLSAPFSTDLSAVPVGDLRWGSCATAGAFHDRLNERDSLGSVIDPIVGSKVWISTTAPTNAFHGAASFFRNDIESDKTTLGRAVEAIILEPGTRLIAKPNAPHAIYNYTNAICRGSHFIASSTMTETLSGLFHALTINDYATTTLRRETKHIVRRIIVFYHMALSQGSDPAREHVPDLENMDSLMDTITTCIMGIFTNMLDPDTYVLPISESNVTEEERLQFERDDFNGMIKIDRMACTYVRGLSWSLLNWLNRNFLLSNNDHIVDIVDLSNRLMLHLSISLWRNRTRPTDQAVNGVPAYNPDIIKRQLEGLFNEDSQIRSQFKENVEKDEEPTDFNTSGYTVKRRELPLSPIHLSSVDYFIGIGVNPSDKSYYESIYGNIENMLKAVKQMNKGM